MQLYVSSTNLLTFSGAYTMDVHGAQTPFTSGTITVQIQDLAGNNIGSTISLTYAAGASTINGIMYATGNWSGELGSDAPLVQGTEYEAIVVITASGNTKPDRTLKFQVWADYATRRRCATTD